ncbi:transcriptional regulatory protein [Zafaria cholistanensis]|uniref:Transcriptional regulatory protein n=1 Tax=Zafaria cholistanensis TaxID=1682741 RepID=A0A5A7NUF9_9MICC|nr:response regulator [Zafaria cholistanensis]GER24296.1 transcriptional regulatory protein [Zafaria cholistanensis]
MTAAHDIRVLVVDDEQIAAEAHASYVRRLEGFTLAGAARSTRAALEALQAAQAAGEPVQLVLLDMNLTDGHGLDLLRRIRGLGLMPDIIAITAVRELSIVRSAIALGVTQYLVKPFTFAAFRDKLEGYRAYRQALGGGDAAASATAVDQEAIDAALATLRPSGPMPLPKGLLPETLRAVATFLRAAPTPVSATEVAEALQMSRVTARRYLEHLAAQGRARKDPRHGTRGRPELEYRWEG